MFVDASASLVAQMLCISTTGTSACTSAGAGASSSGRPLGGPWMARSAGSSGPAAGLRQALGRWPARPAEPLALVVLVVQVVMAVLAVLAVFGTSALRPPIFRR